jgi:hypothetical protein
MKMMKMKRKMKRKTKRKSERGVHSEQGGLICSFFSSEILLGEASEGCP